MVGLVKVVLSGVALALKLNYMINIIDYPAGGIPL